MYLAKTILLIIREINHRCPRETLASVLNFVQLVLKVTLSKVMAKRVVCLMILKTMIMAITIATVTDTRGTKDPQTETGAVAGGLLVETGEGRGTETEAGVEVKTEVGREAGRERGDEAGTGRKAEEDPEIEEEAGRKTGSAVGRENGDGVVTGIVEGADRMNERRRNLKKQMDHCLKSRPVNRWRCQVHRGIEVRTAWTLSHPIHGKDQTQIRALRK